MILPGKYLVPKIVNGVRCAKTQIQPCGLDLSLKRVLQWTSSGTVDFDNTRRTTASTEEIPFVETPPQPPPTNCHFTSAVKDSDPASVTLPPGSYLVEFNETVDVPLDLMGQIFVRSSLFRSGALLSAGVMDSGYKGAVGALLQVVNLHGIRLHQDARLAQMVFHEMSEAVEGYKGLYQGRTFV